jgi:hypothetical protein
MRLVARRTRKAPITPAIAPDAPTSGTVLSGDPAAEAAAARAPETK